MATFDDIGHTGANLKPRLQFFYTPAVGERDFVISPSTDPAYTPNDDLWPYFYQGSTFEQPHSSPGEVPVYRFYNRLTVLWNDESIGFYGEHAAEAGAMAGAAPRNG